ncbi:MAG: hypothetical protein QXL91_04745 [Candidatus Bathyarchaeia archaeon]
MTELMCPHCGSIDIVKLKNGKYKCSTCGYEDVYEIFEATYWDEEDLMDEDII